MIGDMFEVYMCLLKLSADEESVRNKQQIKHHEAVDLIYMKITPVEKTALNNVHISEDTS